jgi:hypothetical protein
MIVVWGIAGTGSRAISEGAGSREASDGIPDAVGVTGVVTRDASATLGASTRGDAPALGDAPAALGDAPAATGVTALGDAAAAAGAAAPPVCSHAGAASAASTNPITRPLCLRAVN